MRCVKTLATLLLLFGLVWSVSARPSNALINPGSDNPTPTADTAKGSPEAIVVSAPDGSHHEIRRSGPKYKGTWTCHYYPVGAANERPTMPVIQIWLPPITPQADQAVGLVCRDDAGLIAYHEMFVFHPGNPFGPLELPERVAAEARKLLPLDPPDMALSPPATGSQLVGLPTWFWVTDAWQPLQASATLDGVTATVIATPTSLTFAFADGTTLACDGPGTPYDPTRDPADQQSACTRTFERRGTEVVTATITYATRWTANTGAGGELDDVLRTSTLPITIQEAQALIR